MTILITGDWHFGDSPRDYYRHTFQKTLRSIVRRKDVELVVVLGDLCEEKDEHSAWLVNAVVDHIHKLAKLCPVIVLKGNHDYLNPDNPFWGFLERVEGVRWVSAPTEGKSLSCPPLARLGRVLFLPHTYNPDRDWKGLDLGADWVFAHQTFQGAHVGHGRQMKGVDPARFPEGTRIISGDIHVPQKLGPVTYAGAPYTVDFGDSYQPRVLLLRDGDLKSMKLSGPQKRLVEMTAGEVNDFPEDINPRDILKVRVNVPQKLYAKWPQILARIRAWGEEHEFLIHSVQPVMVREKGKVGKRRTRSRKEDPAVLDEYVSSMGVDKATAKVGKKLLDAA